MKRQTLAVLIFLASTSALVAQATVPDPLGTLVQTLSNIDSPTIQATILRGMNTSLKGRSGLQAPENWGTLYEKLKASPNAEVRDLAQALGGTFGSCAVLAEMRRALADGSAPLAARRTALETLGAAKDAAALPTLLDLLKQPGELRAQTLRTLAGYGDARIAPAILAHLATLNSAEKSAALNSLVSRPANARALAKAIDAGTVARTEITAPLARQLQNLNDPEINGWLAKTWGTVKTTSAEKQAQIAKFKEFLAPNLILAADVHRGRAIFAQTCAACHALHGAGGKIGPELPGSFEDIDYLLQNILDPNAIIGKDYQQTFVTLQDGQVVSGIVAGEDATTVTLKTLGDAVTVQRDKIAEMKLSEQSMMPEGLLAALDEQTVRDLFLYLRQKRQTLMLATTVNSNDLFPRTDFNQWRRSSPTAWQIEGGEIVGQSSEARPQTLVSEMAAETFRFTASIKVLGKNAAAEVILRGRVGSQGFGGATLSLGGGTPANAWLYAGREAKPETRGSFPIRAEEWVQVEVVASGEQTELKLGGQRVLTLSAGAINRTTFGFYIANGELRIKEPKLELRVIELSTPGVR